VYPAVLTIHSWLRWVALLLGTAATFNAYRHRADTSERPRGRWWDTFFMLALDLQVLFGLLLYLGLSPFSREVWNNAGGALRDPALRFWGFEHALMMFGAAAAVRVGRVYAIGVKTTATRRNGRYIWFGVSMFAMLAGVPWPGLAGGRPLFRL
jgi:hypothetical protein